MDEVGKTDSDEALSVYSVRRGDLERHVSPNIVAGLQEAKSRGTRILGIDGREGSYSKKVSDAVAVIPTVTAERVTAHFEAFQAVVWHCLVSSPNLQQAATKW